MGKQPQARETGQKQRARGAGDLGRTGWSATPSARPAHSVGAGPGEARDRSDLLVEPGLVPVGPALHDLVIRDPEYGDAGPAHRPPRRREIGEGALVGAVDGPAYDHLVAGGDGFVEGELEIREAGPVSPDVLDHAAGSRRKLGCRGVVVGVVRGKARLGEFLVAVLPDLAEDPFHQLDGFGIGRRPRRVAVLAEHGLEVLIGKALVGVFGSGVLFHGSKDRLVGFGPELLAADASEDTGHWVPPLERKTNQRRAGDRQLNDLESFVADRRGGNETRGFAFPARSGNAVTGPYCGAPE